MPVGHLSANTEGPALLQIVVDKQQILQVVPGLQGLPLYLQHLHAHVHVPVPRCKVVYRPIITCLHDVHSDSVVLFLSLQTGDHIRYPPPCSLPWLLELASKLALQRRLSSA